MISDLSTRQSQSTALVLQGVLETGQETTRTIQQNSLASREQAFSLHQKLDRIDWLMGAVRIRMDDLSLAQQYARTRTSNKTQDALGNIQRSVWLLVSALHVLIRELM
jgi:hypothetical protein